MADVEDYSTTAASNTSQFPENQAPSTVNDGARTFQAHVAAWHQRITGTVTAGGSADALTATFSPAHSALAERVILVKAASDNATTTPTLNLDSLGAKTIVKNGNEALVAGDIQAGQILILWYNTSTTKWELLNPALGLASERANHTGTQTLATISDSGALAALNTVDQSTIDNSSIGQGELKSTTASQSTSVGATSVDYISPTGGSYTLGWFLGENSSGTLRIAGHNTTYAAKVGIYNTSGILTAYLYSRYIQASPPYNLGYGEIPRFNLVLLDKTTMEVLGTYSAEDPPWAYHGPHNLHPIDGIIQRAVGMWGMSIPGALKADREGTLEKLRLMKELKADKKLMAEARKRHAFTIEEKNIDMDVVPHLFSNYDPAKHVVVMLDPCCNCAEELALCEEFTGEDYSISSLLHDGYVKITNDELNVRTPKGVKTVKFRMK